MARTAAASRMAASLLALALPALLLQSAAGQAVFQVVGSASFKFNPGKDLTWQEMQTCLSPQSDIKLLSG
jgi:hypothetical protein